MFWIGLAITILGIGASRPTSNRQLRSLLPIFLALAALAFPTFEDTSSATPPPIWLALDVSRSMLARDVTPNRLEAGQRLYLDLIERLEPHPVGLIAFTGQAQVICPLTTDRVMLASAVRSLTIDTVADAGSDVGAPLRLLQTKTNDGPSLLVLASDGGETTPAMPTVIDDVTVLAVGVGADDHDSPIPLDDVGTKLERFGRPVQTRLNPESLRNLAQQTQGAYVPLRANVATIHATLLRLQQGLAADPVSAPAAVRTVLLAAAGLAAIAAMIHSAQATSFACLLLLLSGCTADRDRSRLLQALREQQAGRSEAAIERYAALRESPAVGPWAQFGLANELARSSTPADVSAAIVLYQSLRDSAVDAEAVATNLELARRRQRAMDGQRSATSPATGESSDAPATADTRPTTKSSSNTQPGDDRPGAAERPTPGLPWVDPGALSITQARARLAERIAQLRATPRPASSVVPRQNDDY